MKTRALSSFAAIVLLSLAVAAPCVARTPRASDDALSLVPADAASVAVVRFSELRSSPLAGKLFANADSITVDGDAARFLEDARLQPKKDVDTVVIAGMPSAGGGDTPILVMFEGRFDPERLAAAAVGRGAELRTAPAGDYYLLPQKSEKGKKGAAAFVSRRLILVGSEPEVIQALANREAGGTGFAGGAGPLGRQLGRIDRSASAWALVDVSRHPFGRKGGAHIHIEREGSSEPVVSLLGAMTSVSLVSLQASARGDALELSIGGVCADSETRQLIEDSLKGILAMWRLAAQEKSPELVSALRKFAVTSGSDGVFVKGTLPGSFLRAMADKAERKRSEQR
ncbi:MAG TPA: hypothetical protein VER78_05980 [Thermoanaerobaculia bacterium]|nr:hypothetical protein [Thermoanaerobaculia bacterium]